MNVLHDSPKYTLKDQAKYFKYMLPFQSPPFPLTEMNCKDDFPNNSVKWTAVQKDLCEGQIGEEERIYLLWPKVSLYTDNSNVLLNLQSGSLHSLIEDLDHFSNLSGVQPNYDKCY